MKILFNFILILFCLPAFSYIPDYKTIMSRVAENHGHGNYKIVRDIVFPADPEPFVIKETWHVGGDYEMSVELAGKGTLAGKVSGKIIYEKNRKFYFTDGLKTSRLPEDFLETLFIFRYSKNIKPQLVNMKITPSKSLQPRPLFTGEKGETFPSQDFLRLSRTGGVVNYAIGQPTPANQAEENPGLWVEQDRFHIRKVRTENNAMVEAQNYARFARRFWFPKAQLYSWENHSAKSLLNDVVALPSTAKVNNIMKASSLKKDGIEAPLVLPDVEIIKEFYSRFR